MNTGLIKSKPNKDQVKDKSKFNDANDQQMNGTSKINNRRTSLRMSMISSNLSPNQIPPPPPPPNQTTPDWAQKRRTFFSSSSVSSDQKAFGKDNKLGKRSPSNFVIPEHTVAPSTQASMSSSSILGAQRSFDVMKMAETASKSIIESDEYQPIAFQQKSHKNFQAFTSSDPYRAYPSYLHSSAIGNQFAVTSTTSAAEEKSLNNTSTKPRAFPRTNPSYTGTYRRTRVTQQNNVDSFTQKLHTQHLQRQIIKNKLKQPTLDDNFLYNPYANQTQMQQNNNFNYYNNQQNKQNQIDYKSLMSQSIYANALDLKTPDTYYNLNNNDFIHSKFNNHQYRSPANHPPPIYPHALYLEEPIYSNDLNDFVETPARSKIKQNGPQKAKKNPFIFMVSCFLLEIILKMYWVK